jgi:hypothetical protein
MTMSWLLLLLLFWKNLLSPRSTLEGTFETSTPFLEKKGCPVGIGVMCPPSKLEVVSSQATWVASRRLHFSVVSLPKKL